VAFHKQKQMRRGGAEADYMQSIKISPAEGESTLKWKSARILTNFQSSRFVS
jgi:hypothetical protein